MAQVKKGPWQEASDAVDRVIGMMMDAVDEQTFLDFDEVEGYHYDGLYDLAEELVAMLDRYREHVGMEIEVELE